MAFRDLQGLANTTLFSLAHFGESIIYTPAGVGQTPVDVVGVPKMEPVLTDGVIPISSTRQQMDLRAADIVGGPQARASILWRGVSYRIESVDGPDDSGVCTCTLMRLTNP